MTLDLGHKAIAADPDGVRGIVLNVEGAEVDKQHEEHWRLTSLTAHRCTSDKRFMSARRISARVSPYIRFTMSIDTDGYCPWYMGSHST